MKTFFYCLCQWTWGLPQSLLGLVVLLLNWNRPHFRYHGAIVTCWSNSGGLGVGMFVFLPPTEDGDLPCSLPLLVHEYGHTIQSLFLGPLFLPLVGLPSFLWCNLKPLRRLRQRKKLSYYAVYPENWANSLGERVLKESAKS